ncbi:Abi-alpha family protein [Nocardioides sp.]|uniref:Abi-alpha family protein n=1 Tax=Nocardioides sp. TaxID=35761 RepID=UPI0039E3B81C
MTEPAELAKPGRFSVVPGVVRIGLETVVHTTTWTATMYAKGWLRVAKAVVDPDAAAALSGDLATVTGTLVDIAHTVSRGGPVTGLVGRIAAPALEAVQSTFEAAGGNRAVWTEEDRLRSSGAALLERSRDVYTDQSRHPAYASILKELAPDEARILVLLLRDGPQPCVDVRQGGTMGRLQPRVVARGLSMIGIRAGVRYHESVPAYLNNLTRLGLIWQSPEPVGELLRYQVVEAQPDVLEAKHTVRKSHVVRRSIHLTPFGSDFARLCFASEAEVEADLFPGHEAPPDAATESTVDD